MYQSNAMGDKELLADIIGTKSANLIMNKIGLGGLAEIGEGRLLDLGLSQKQTFALLAGMEITKRVSEFCARGKPISCSEDIYNLYSMALPMLKKEQFIVVLLNSKNKIVGEKIVSQGSINECRVNAVDVFSFAVQESCNRICLIHNHPSGDHTPSPEDAALTRRLMEAGEILGITILDHVIFGKGSYSSLRDLGIIAGNGSICM